MKLLAAILPHYYGRLLVLIMGLSWPHDSMKLSRMVHSYCIFDCAKIRVTLSKERHISSTSKVFLMLLLFEVILSSIYFKFNIVINEKKMAKKWLSRMKGS